MTRMNTLDNALDFLPREALSGFLSALAGSCELWVPQGVGEGARFLPYGGDKEVDLDTVPPHHPIKSVLFPNPETLFRYERGKGGKVTLSYCADSPDFPLVIFGARSCDIRAIDALDAVFLRRSRPDTTYHRRRKRLLVIGMACVAPGPACFCDRMGGGPFDEAGMDIQVVPLPEGHGFRPLTPQGEAFLAPYKDFFEPPPPDGLKQVAALRKTKTAASGAPVDFPVLKEALNAGRKDPFWEEMASACLGCGLCTFLCPVCSCFSLADEGQRQGGRRLRHWDACMFPAFTREASGHNPRGTAIRRIQQRFFHKFFYSLEWGEPPGCVGCGRCVTQCPAAIDIREVIRHFQPGEDVG